MTIGTNIAIAIDRASNQTQARILGDYTTRIEADSIILRAGIDADTLEAKQQLIRIHRYMVATLRG